MDIEYIIQELGGGLPAIVLVAMGGFIYLERKRANAATARGDAMSDKVLKISMDSTIALNKMADKLERIVK
jgi:hypothetical protein